MLFLKLFEIFIFEAFLTFWGGLNSNYSNNKDVVMIRGQMRLISSHVFILEQIIVLCPIKYFFIQLQFKSNFSETLWCVDNPFSSRPEIKNLTQQN